jgi:PAS domain S-box-containing protein
MIGVTFHFFKNLSKFNVLVQIMAIASLMVISIILPDRVLFGANSADHFSNVAESFNIKLVSKGFTLWRAFFDLNILLFVFAIISIVLKRGNSFGSKAIFILYTGAGLLLLSALSDQLVDLGYIDTIYLLPFAIFLFYLILNIIPYLFLLNDVFENHLVNEKERTWRNLVNEAKVIVIGLNRMGLVEFMNPYFIDITGYEKDEVLGKDWFELFLPKERYNEVQGAFIEGLEFEFHAYYVNPILKKNNEELVIKWYNVRNRDENGTITGSYSIGIDITEESLEKEESARKLNEAEELIEKLKREIPGA